MKTETYDIIIDKISSVHGEYPGSVDVSFHREGGNLEGRDVFEDQRVTLSSKIIKADGSVDQDQVAVEVIAAIGTQEIVEIEDTTKFGTLCDYKTGNSIRPATEQEWRASREAEKSNIGGGTGVIDVGGQSVYVDGGPELGAEQ